MLLDIASLVANQDIKTIEKGVLDFIELEDLEILLNQSISQLPKDVEDVAQHLLSLASSHILVGFNEFNHRVDLFLVELFNSDIVETLHHSQFHIITGDVQAREEQVLSLVGIELAGCLLEWIDAVVRFLADYSD